MQTDNAAFARGLPFFLALNPLSLLSSKPSTPSKKEISSAGLGDTASWDRIEMIDHVTSITIHVSTPETAEIIGLSLVRPLILYFHTHMKVKEWLNQRPLLSSPLSNPHDTYFQFNFPFHLVCMRPESTMLSLHKASILLRFSLLTVYNTEER